jgi:molybdopterin synthase catalytic subunit
MRIAIEFTRQPITRPDPAACLANGRIGAWVEFAGVVRGLENGIPIAALEYEAYETMARQVMHNILDDLATRLACESTSIIHRIGVVPVGELAIWIGVASSHRGPALALVAEFMDQLKLDVPIWKHRALTTTDLGKPTP